MTQETPTLVFKADDKIRLFAALNEPIEIESEALWPIGTEVNVDFQIGDAPLGLRLLGTIIGVRHPARHLAPTLWVEFPAAAKRQAKLRFDIIDGDSEQLAVRKNGRTTCHCPIQFESPIEHRDVVVDISESGFRIQGTLPVPLRQTVKCRLIFEHGDIPVFGRVIWRRVDPTQPHRSGTGLAFLFHHPNARTAVSTILNRLKNTKALEPDQKRWLIFNSDEGFNEGLKRLLAPKNIELKSCTNGIDALINIRQTKPHAILAANKQSNADAFFQILARSPTLSATPIVALGTSKASDAELTASYTLPEHFKSETLLSFLSDIDRPFASPTKAQLPFFARCRYKSSHLETETTILAIRSSQVFIVSWWQQKIGTKGSLSLFLESKGELELQTTVHSLETYEAGQARPPGFWLSLSTHNADALKALLTDTDTQETKPCVLALHSDSELIRHWYELCRAMGVHLIPIRQAAHAAQVIVTMRPRLVLIEQALSDKSGLEIAIKLAKESHSAQNGTAEASPSPQFWLLGHLPEAAKTDLLDKTPLSGIWPPDQSIQELLEQACF